MVWTSPWRDNQDALNKGTQLASWFGCRFVRRHERSIARVLEDEGADVLGVWDQRPVLYHRSEPNRPVFFHPGMAQQRVTAHRRGEHDRLLRVAGVRPGDVVIDATLGMGVDTLVLAYGVGAMGRVVGVESSRPMARLFSYAIVHPDLTYGWWHPLFERIQVVEGNHTQYLAKLEDNSADIVLFDPMFRQPPHGPTSIDPARAMATPDALSPDAWHHAQRVARRCVVLKERPLSGEFERYGIIPDKQRATFAYGVWRKGE